MTKTIDIVCTIGPVTESYEKLEELCDAGMTVARLNFSHGDFAEHQHKLDNIMKLRKENKYIKILQDLSGPKIRIGDFETPTINLIPGNSIIIEAGDFTGNADRISVNYPLLAQELTVGGYVMIHDGKFKLQVSKIENGKIHCQIITGGSIKPRRGVNLPGAYLSIPALTEKDRADVEFGIQNNVDMIALSFVRRAQDIVDLREILDARNCSAQIIAKIETPEALENIDSIIALVDGIMIARGDLGVEIPREDVPFAQKMLIKKCNLAGKWVITATQMMDSMIHNFVPTRAEVSDVAYAVLDGSNAIMTSEETTLGSYPVETVSIMSTIAERAASERV